MVDVRPFHALRPPRSVAARVAALPYDVMSTDEARAMAAGNPDSFLHVSRAEIDLPADVDPHTDEVYALGRSTLAELVARGVLVRDPDPTYSVYRQVMGAVRQTGVVAVVSVADYDSGAVRTHELDPPRQGALPGPAHRRARRAGRAGVPARAALRRRRCCHRRGRREESRSPTSSATTTSPTRCGRSAAMLPRSPH